METPYDEALCTLWLVALLHFGALPARQAANLVMLMGHQDIFATAARSFSNTKKPLSNFKRGIQTFIQ